ncbi:MAG: arsenite methyltransferase [Phycisphaeraceae bacterium]|nr:arsenite methyltransferase [Phycisphaeraceae bacterium]
MNQATKSVSTRSNDPGSCGCGPACCGGEAKRNGNAAAPTATDVHEQVRRGYGEIARRGGWSATGNAAESSVGCCGPSSAGAGGCCGPATLTTEQVAAAVGYGAGDLAALPEGANLGLSCGNPTALAALRPGEIVLDLGSGAGLDCFIAGPRVGAAGRVIGVDMTPDMLAKARRNLAGYRERSGLDNVEFRLGEIESLPVADASVDVVISNCVINLSPDKPRVFGEIARVLRPGGRVAVSDLALLRPLPESIRADVEALVGCVAGAALVDELASMARVAGLTDVRIEPKAGYVQAMTAWQDPLYRRIIERLPDGTTPADFITSVDLSARKA